MLCYSMLYHIVSYYIVLYYVILLYHSWLAGWPASSCDAALAEAAAANPLDANVFVALLKHTRIKHNINNTSNKTRVRGPPGLFLTRLGLPLPLQALSSSPSQTSDSLRGSSVKIGTIHGPGRDPGDEADSLSLYINK